MDFLVEVRKRRNLEGQEVMVHPDLKPRNLPMAGLNPHHPLDPQDPHHLLGIPNLTCLEAMLVEIDLNLLEPQDPQDPHQDLLPPITIMVDLLLLLLLLLTPMAPLKLLL